MDSILVPGSASSAPLIDVAKHGLDLIPCSATAWLNKVLEDEELQAEWVLWVDIDTVILDLNFTLPFEEFAAKSKDLVVYGNLTQVKAGHPIEGESFPLSCDQSPRLHRQSQRL